MIKYRKFKWEPDRGMLSVEYGERGSGVTATISVMEKVPPGQKLTPELVHQLCVEACPVDIFDRAKRASEFASEEVELLTETTERRISNQEEQNQRRRAHRRPAGIPVIDTRKL